MAKKSVLTVEEKYRLYEASVQNPESDIAFINKEYNRIHGRKPLTLREDFCGTGMMACAWTKQSEKHFSWGIDLDPEPLAYGEKYHFDLLTLEEQKRATFIRGNVLNNYKFKTDVVVAFNFSYFLFKERNLLLKYFKQVRKHLKKNGAFFIDLFGGTEARMPLEEKVKHKHHTYFWDCESYNPLTAECRYRIHFQTHDDGQKHLNVFTYDWRMWDPQELRDILADAGFKKSYIYWEGVDKHGHGDGKFVATNVAENCESWVTYICAIP